MSEYISNRYMIIKEIGTGGMADVYLALDTILNREVAIKILKGNLSSDAVALERFRREANAITSLSHPNIVDIYDVGEDHNRHYIVMEYIKGHTLKQLIQKRGALPFKEAVWLTKQLALALAEAHRNGIIHRDIKAQNVLIKDDGTIKIADFGIALAHDALEITSKDAVIGSVHYIAPELTKGAQATMQSDIYSLGIVFYEMLTGDLPYKGDQAIQIALKHINEPFPSVRAYNHDIPQSVENIIFKATAKDLNKRYSNIALMIQDLNDCLKPEHLNDAKVALDVPGKTEVPSQNVVKISGRDESKTVKANRRSKILTALYIILGIILSLAIIFLILVLSGVIKAPTQNVKVPDITDMSVIEANDYLMEYGISIDLSDIERVMTDDIAEGKIIDYAPKDQEVERGSKIHVTVSSGTYAQMGDYVNTDIKDAVKDLQSKNFTVETKAMESPLQPGTVVMQEGFQKGDKYDPNKVNEITLYYSQYPSIILENIKGRNVYDVYNELTEKGLEVEMILSDQSTFTATETEQYAPETVVRVVPQEGSAYTQEDDRTIKLYYYQQ